MTKTWTIESVKNELPGVPVLVDGKRRKARIVGRMNKWATLLIDPTGIPIEFAVAWTTIVSVLNRESTVRL